MRMRHSFEAYFDDFDFINVYISKELHGGFSQQFHLKDAFDQIIPLSIVSQSHLYNGYVHYQLRCNANIIVGYEYKIYDDHCKTTVVQYAHIVKTKRFNLIYQYDGKDLGLTYGPEKSVFKLWAPTASKISVHLWNQNDDIVIPMIREDHGLFTAEVREDLYQMKYTYLVRVNGRLNEIVDPYSSFCGPNTSYSVVMDRRHISFPDKIECPPMKSNCDAIIYEVNIRDMTSQNDLPIVHRKKFKGFTEENDATISRQIGFSYLKSLGITHLQLMPVMDFGTVDEVYQNIYYNWGYDPVHPRVLEGSYSIDPKNAGLRIEEFANLVQDCHKAGIRVVLDVVFNHVYEKKNFHLDKLVPDYYFLMDQQGEYSNGSFCGNDIDTQPPMSRRYILDTCQRLIEWFDIDGFRFDLMGILDVNLMNDIAEMSKKLKPDFMLYGEGWNMPSFVPEDIRASQQNQAKMPFIGHFSDAFRETVRGSNGDLDMPGYSNGDLGLIYTMMDRLSASGRDYDSPEKVINYVECHDNHTLWDKNLICCAGKDAATRMRLQLLATAMVILSQGVPFLHAGQEFARTKQKIGNTYNLPDTYNMMDYVRKDTNEPLVQRVRELIAIRKEHSCFRLSTTEQTRYQVWFDTLDEKVLIYTCQDEHSQCTTFFNPSSDRYHYHYDEPKEILFDSERKNEGSLYDLSIEPYSVVIVKE